jgi:hypothetical protein
VAVTKRSSSSSSSSTEAPAFFDLNNLFKVDELDGTCFKPPKYLSIASEAIDTAMGEGQAASAMRQRRVYVSDQGSLQESSQQDSGLQENSMCALFISSAFAANSCIQQQDYGQSYCRVQQLQPRTPTGDYSRAVLLGVYSIYKTNPVMLLTIHTLVRCLMLLCAATGAASRAALGVACCAAASRHQCLSSSQQHPATGAAVASTT